MVDLTDRSVLIRGTDFWYYESDADSVIQEPRLFRVLMHRLRPRQIPLNPKAPFRAPPAPSGDTPTRKEGIYVEVFPTWFVCQNPDCRRLFKPTRQELAAGSPVHRECNPKGSDCVPVRFVVTCKRGHLDEFPWCWFVHQDAQCEGPLLSLREGATGDFSEIRVHCVCGASRRLSEALVEETNPKCNGRRPWLGNDAKEADCPERQRLLVRTATNTYFSHCESALSIPEPERETDAHVERAAGDLEEVTSAQDIQALRAALPRLERALSGISSEEAWAALQRLRGETTAAPEGIRTMEFRQFLAQPEGDGEVPERGETFFARRCPAPEGGLPPQIERVVLAHKLREVRVQLGFTRSEPLSPDLQGEFNLGVQLARLGLKTSWLPASEIRGEGLFVRLDEAALAAWEARPAVRERERQLRDGHQAFSASVDGALPFPGARFYLLHSLSHLLMTAISLECGYGVSAIHERLYCAEAGSPMPMAALLLSTGTPGSEGTLGGLVEQGKFLVEHLRRAYDDAELCAYDPVCAAHSPSGDLTERYLEGAACHGCLYIAEPSCERFNRYLDRALVVPTLGHDPSLAFFPARP